MNVKRYYRAYNDLIKKYERLSYRVVLKGFKGIYSRASEQYLNRPDTPLELLVNEQDTLDILVQIYDSIGIATGLLVAESLPKQKGKSLNLSTKAGKKPKQYVPTPDDAEGNTHVNYWKQEFLRFTQSADCASKVRGITNTTRNEIRKIMTSGVNDQLSHKQIAKLIQDNATEITTKRRALTIARTEGSVGSNLGAMYSAKSSGLVLYKQWIARSGDNRTRDYHVGMVDSAPIPIDDLFVVGGEKMSQPGDSTHGAKGHNIINCRCCVGFVPISEIIPVGTNPTGKPARKPRVVKPKVPVNTPELFDDIVNIPIPKKGYIPVKTIEEASQWAVDNGIAKEVNYAWCKDVDVANEINRTLYNLKDKFNFDTLDQIGNRPKSSTALMSANFRNLNIKHSHWKTNKILSKNYEVGNLVTYAERSLKNAEACRRNYEISKNYKWITKAKEFEEKAKYSRFTVDYSAEKYLESTINHEFGHVLHDQLIGGINGRRVISQTRLNQDGYINLINSLDEEQRLIFRTAKANGDIYKISAYASENNKEFFSETFVMWLAKDPDLPVYISEFFDKFFKLTQL